MKIIKISSENLVECHRINQENTPEVGSRTLEGLQNSLEKPQKSYNIMRKAFKTNQRKIQIFDLFAFFAKAPLLKNGLFHKSKRDMGTSGGAHRAVLSKLQLTIQNVPWVVVLIH